MGILAILWFELESNSDLQKNHLKVVPYKNDGNVLGKKGQTP